MLIFGPGGLEGGADLAPHLRLIQQMGEDPGLRNVYAPAYHVVGALLAPWLGISTAIKLMTLGCAAALIAGFRSFQRAAGLPADAAALFAWSPYTFALSWCIPKIEAGGYALAFLGLALLFRRRHWAAALCLVATFWVHTAAALFFGLCGGLLALARRDSRALAALAGGTLGAAPLLAVHLASGCSFAESLLFSPGDYLRAPGRWSSFAQWDRIVVLAGPIALACAAAGAGRLWREYRSVAITAVGVTLLYLNEIWLAPFGLHNTLNLLRGLTVLAFPVAAAGGVFLATRPRWTLAVAAACAAWAVGAAALTVPAACHRAPVDVAAVGSLDVDRCAFRWRVKVRR